MISSFSILQDKWPVLLNIAEQAENNLYTDSNTALFKLRLFVEKLTDHIFTEEKILPPTVDNLNERLRILKMKDILPVEILDYMHRIKNAGNKATHEGAGTETEAAIMLRFAFSTALHCAYVYHEQNIKGMQYKLPEKAPDHKAIIQKLENEYKVLETAYQSLAEKNKTEQPDKIKIEKRRKRSLETINLIPRTEAETRLLIDEQLRKAGWIADTENIRHSKGIRPEKNKNYAIAEWPTTDGGFADYALFAGLFFVGVIEAKKYVHDIVSDLGQSQRYSLHIAESDNYILSNNVYGNYRVPFLFSSNGRPYLEQLKEKSGIWFQDVRSNLNHPRALQSWYTPDGLLNLIEKDSDKAAQALKKEPFDYLQDSNGLSLRDYQVDVIKKVEEHLTKGNNTALIMMATGTGKTRTAIGMTYRFLKTKKFKRILFLVDRNSLGTQAAENFEDATIEDLLTFNQIFDIKKLDDKKPDINTKVHFATVQGILRRVYYNDDPDEILPVDTYDCIIVDEAHRGYFLDRELSEEELLYKNQWDYISRYRQVLGYFDAVKIGLTATPATHTVEIFGEQVATYTYRQAVIDGVLVDHDPPHIIKTKLSTEGIKWEKGDVAPVLFPDSVEVKKVAIEDELQFDIEDFNKKVLSENFNRTVVDYLVQNIDPDSREKTLIFAANNDHADKVVNLLKMAYGAIDDDAIKKITASVDKPDELIKRFKNEHYPSIVVTVDLLTTGIDVRSICNIVFLRRVKSRILYEQMIGRATRTCDEIGKDHFDIYDAVGLYEALEPFTQMKPVVKDPTSSISGFIDELNRAESAETKKNIIDSIISRLNRREKNLSDDSCQKVSTATGKSRIADFINEFKDLPINKQIEFINNRRDTFELFDKLKNRKDVVFISNHDDELHKVERGYGKDGKINRPEDYIEMFNEYIIKHKNDLIALKTVLQRPKALTRQVLKELILELDKEGFNVTALNDAWKRMKNEDMAASIVGFIRQQALGDPLIPHEERVDKAIAKIKSIKPWNKRQEQWIERIGLQLKKEIVIDKDSFNKDPFRQYGGYDQINKILDSELDVIMDRIYDVIYSA